MTFLYSRPDKSSNQSLQPTASRRITLFQMIKTLQPAATPAPTSPALQPTPARRVSLPSVISLPYCFASRALAGVAELLSRYVYACGMATRATYGIGMCGSTDATTVVGSASRETDCPFVGRAGKEGYDLGAAA
jgi:hypothetical protein